MKRSLFSALAIGGLFTLVNTAIGGPFTQSSEPDSFLIYNGGGFVAIGDVNGDGKPDLVSADTLNNLVIVETNAGNGVFSYSQAPFEYSTGANPVMVAIADINGDGKPDLVVANQGGNSITILTNTGAGIFGSYATYPVAVSPTFLLVTDINGDGRPDIIIASQNTSLNPYVGTLTILTNAGGTFPVAHTLVVNNTNTLVDSIAVADINGDGKPDLVVGGQDYNNSGKSLIEILTNAGGGIFVSNAVISSPFSFGPVSLVAADFNKDGQMDIAFLSGESGFPTITICTNRNGILTTSQTIFLPSELPVPPGPLLPTAPVPVSYNQLMVADLDGDGYPDLLFTGTMNTGFGNDWILKILFNTGTGGLFETNYLSAGAPGAAGVTNSTDMYIGGNTPKLWTAVADLNGDGKPDLAGAVVNGPASYISALFVMTNDISNLISLAVPTNIIASATSPYGAVVNFLPTWTNWMGALLVTNTPYPSGSLFPDFETNHILSSTAYFLKSNLSASTNATFNVIVLDFPTITLLGPNPLTNFVGGYVDPGVTLSDPGGYGVNYYISGNVDTNVPGTYTVTYTATNYFGNVAVTNRTVVLIPQPPLGIASAVGNQAALFWAASGATNYTVQMTTNLNSGPWVTVTNSTPMMGIFVTNSAPAAFFRLQPQ